MKHIHTKSLVALTLATALNAAAPAGTAPVPAKEATQITILQARTGQQVEPRLNSGDGISGKVAAVGDQLVHLTALTGMEMYEATVTLSEISAVIVRSTIK